MFFLFLVVTYLTLNKDAKFLNKGTFVRDHDRDHNCNRDRDYNCNCDRDHNCNRDRDNQSVSLYTAERLFGFLLHGSTTALGAVCTVLRATGAATSNTSSVIALATVCTVLCATGASEMTMVALRTSCVIIIIVLCI